jgi:hypothetical protein
MDKSNKKKALARERHQMMMNGWEYNNIKA